MKTRHKIMSFLLSGAMVFSLLPASAIGTVKAASVNYALTATGLFPIIHDTLSQVP